MRSMRVRNPLRVLAVAAFAATAAIAGTFHERVIERREAFPPDLDVLYVPPPGHLESMSVGYREALADLIWVRALIFSGSRIGDHDLDAVSRYVDAITSLAPKFHRAYVWGGITMIYGGAKVVTRPMVERAITVYRRGLNAFPESHELHYAFGMLLTNQVTSTPGYSDEEKKQARREGAEHIRKAAAFGADPLVRQYASTLITDHATDQMAIAFLESELAQAQNEDYRTMLRVKLDRLNATASVDAVDTIREAFFAELVTQKPYMSDSLYAVIRDEASPPADPAVLKAKTP